MVSQEAVMMEYPSIAPFDEDSKKASFYVWSLGNRECGGIRGEEVVIPALRFLMEKERQEQPPKVTLQVSTRGLKIIQTVPKTTGGKTVYELVKNAIPQTSITYVCQGDDENSDVVSCVVLSYSANSKCPVHIHVFRCDSEETATFLFARLQSFTEKPENKRKIEELEQKLKTQGLINEKIGGSRMNLSEKTVATISKFPERERIALLYDSLAAELRDKLNNAQKAAPMVVPSFVEEKKLKRLSLSDMRVVKSETRVNEASSGNSSGIGSDDAASPVLEIKSPRSLSGDSVASDEEWPEKETHWQHRHETTPSKPNHFDSAIELTPQRAASPLAAHERFQSAKSKFLLLEKQQNSPVRRQTSRIEKARYDELPAPKRVEVTKVQRRQSFYDVPKNEERKPTLRRSTSKAMELDFQHASHAFPNSNLPRTPSYQEPKNASRPQLHYDEDGSDLWSSPNSRKIEMVERKGKYSPQFLFSDNSNESLGSHSRNVGRSYNDLRAPMDKENDEYHYKSCVDLRNIPKDRRSVAVPDVHKVDQKSKRMSLAEKIERDTFDRKSVSKPRYVSPEGKRIPGLDRDTARQIDYDRRQEEIRRFEVRQKYVESRNSPFHDHRRDMNQARFERNRFVNARY